MDFTTSDKKAPLESPLMRPIAAVLLLLVPAMSGCLNSVETGVFAGEPENFGLVPTNNPMPFGADHDHNDPDAHRFAENAELLAMDDLRRFGHVENEIPVGAHAMDVHGDRLVVAVFGAHDHRGGQQGFHLYDISQPGVLNHLAFYSAGEPVNGDRTIAFSPDGDFVFLGFEDGERPGVAAISVANPNNVHQVAFWEDDKEFGPHTLSSGEVDGQTYVFALAVGVTILSFTYDEESGRGTFEQVSQYTTADEAAVADAPRHVDPQDPDTYFASYALRSVYAHDTNFYHDPVTDRPLLLVAYAYDGMKILDITNPQSPQLIGRWLPPQDTEHRHYTHSVNAERLDTGEFVIVVGTETFEEENQDLPSPIWVLDGTAMLLEDAPLTEEGVPQPEYLSTWSNPGGAPSGELTNSVHFFRQQDGLLYLSHYHGGIWVIDLRTEADRVRPEHIAYIMPIHDDPLLAPEDCCINFPLAAVPMVFDVAVDANGIVYGADIIQGVSAIRINLDE